MSEREYSFDELLSTNNDAETLREFEGHLLKDIKRTEEEWDSQTLMARMRGEKRTKEILKELDDRLERLRKKLNLLDKEE